MKKSTVAVAIITVIAIASAAVIMINENNRRTNDTGPEVISMQLILTVDGKKIPVNWEDNPSVNAIKTLAKDTLTIEMSRYGGFEQTGNIGQSVVSNDTHISVGCGDIVLYNGEQICLYFDDNSYSFTRLGKMDMADDEIVKILDVPGVKAVFTLE